MNAKTFLIPVVAASALAAVLLSPAPSKGDVGPDDPAFAALINEVVAQQATIADNQTKIDAKLASIGENVRLARIFASRGK